MNQEKIAGLIVVAAIIGALAGYWYGHSTGDITGYSRAQKELSANIISPTPPAGGPPPTNPLGEVKTNPFADVKFNPFE